VLSQASFSPDGRWLLFLSSTAQSARIYAVRPQDLREIPSDRWQLVTDSGAKLDKPRFSPDGGVVYFIADRDGGRAIDAVRFDQQSGSPLGQPLSVLQSGAARLSLMDVSSVALELAISRNRVITILSEITSTIWMADLVPR